jgi:hypothetical protein
MLDGGMLDALSAQVVPDLCIARPATREAPCPLFSEPVVRQEAGLRQPVERRLFLVRGHACPVQPLLDVVPGPVSMPESPKRHLGCIRRLGHGLLRRRLDGLGGGVGLGTLGHREEARRDDLLGTDLGLDPLEDLLRHVRMLA